MLARVILHSAVSGGIVETGGIPFADFKRGAGNMDYAVAVIDGIRDNRVAYRSRIAALSRALGEKCGFVRFDEIFSVREVTTQNKAVKILYSA